MERKNSIITYFILLLLIASIAVNGYLYATKEKDDDEDTKKIARDVDTEEIGKNSDSEEDEEQKDDEEDEDEEDNEDELEKDDEEEMDNEEDEEIVESSDEEIIEEPEETQFEAYRSQKYNFEIYKPIFHVKVIWLLMMGIELLKKGVHLSES